MLLREFGTFTTPKSPIFAVRLQLCRRKGGNITSRYNVQYALGETQSRSLMHQHMLLSNRSDRDEILYPGSPDSVKILIICVG